MGIYFGYTLISGCRHLESERKAAWGSCYNIFPEIQLWQDEDTLFLTSTFLRFSPKVCRKKQSKPTYHRLSKKVFSVLFDKQIPTFANPGFKKSIRTNIEAKHPNYPWKMGRRFNEGGWWLACGGGAMVILRRTPKCIPVPHGSPRYY